MTLTNRLLLYYLGSLIVLLGGFSATLYFLAKDHLQRQSAERLDSALNTLDAAVEITPDGVEWEPREHKLRIASGNTQEQLAWIVTDAEGRIVARSDHPESEDLLQEAAGRLQRSTQQTRRLYWQGERWQAGQRWVTASEVSPIPAEPKVKDPNEVRYPALVITAALPQEPIRAEMRRLLTVLTGVSLGVLLVALLAGRAVCRRALRPVQRMAIDARAIDPDDPNRLITTPQSGDELTDLGLAFNGLLDRLHVSLERQKRFTGDASHQLRTPLAALLGQIEIALRRERTPEEYRQALMAAQAGGGQLQRIIESLLYLTRMDAEGAHPNLEVIDLRDWLVGHLATWVGHPRYREIHVTNVENPLHVLSHSVLLGEVVNILLDNACQYSGNGSRITLVLSQMDGEARLEVSDLGQGIAEADLPHIFTPFFRTRDALRANRNGVGLGLSIAHRLMEALSGSLRVSSEVGAGSCFTIVFPKYSNHA